MKLFTKEVDKQLFAQYPKGSDLENQMVVAKIFNPYGRGVWYLLNSDPNDPDYIWAIVDLFEPDMGSVSRSELQTVKVPPFGLGLERDIYFTPKPAKEVWEGVMRGERFAHGGMTAGRWYKDNSGNEFRFIGESEGKLLFKDGEKIITKSEEDFEDSPKEYKLFGIFADGGEMIPNPKGSYVPIRNQGIWGVQKRVNGEFETFFAVENKNGFDISNDLSKKVNENNEKATFSFWVKDGINAENFISKYLKGYEIEEDEDNRVNVFDLEIVFGKFLSNKSQVKDYIIESEDEYADGGAVKGRNNQTGEYYGVVIGSVQKADDEYTDAIKMNVRTSYESRICESSVLFDKNGNLLTITDYGCAYEGKYPSTGVGSGRNYYADKKETLQILSKKYNPAFAKKLIELAKDIKMAEGGMVQHGLKIGDKITTDMFWDNQIVVENQKTKKRAQINLETGVRKEEMGMGGDTAAAEHNIKQAKYGARLVGKQKNLDVNKNGKLDAEDFKILRGKKMAMGGKVKFEDKVKEVQKSLLKRKKVAPVVQKDYGKTYNRKEALDSAKRIIGAQTAKWEKRNKK